MWTVEFGHRIRKIVKNSRKRICRERSVYSAIRPMAVCAKLLGTFPLSGVLYHKADKLNFSICSCGTLWGAILFSAIITLVIYVSYYFIPFSQLNTFNFWKTIYCWLLMARSILQFLFCHKCARNIPGLLKLLDKSYICRQTDTVVRPWKTMPFLVIIIHIAFIVYLDIEFFGTLLPPDQLTYFTAGLYSLLRIWQIVPLTMYVNICRIMIQGFHLIEQKVDEVLILLEPFYKNYPADVINREEARKMTEKLEWIRLEHALLNKATETLSQSYGVLLLVDYTSMTVVMIVQLYVIAVYEVDVVFLLCAISNFLFGTSAIHVSHVLSKSSEAPLDNLQSVPMFKLHRDIRYQIRMFQNQITSTSVKVSAGGFFKLDRKRIIAMMGTVATYFIILLEYGDFITTQAGIKDGNNSNQTLALSKS